MTVTDDATVIVSENNTSVSNDLALSIGLSDARSLRTSLLTEYNSDPGINMDFNEREEVDNTLGVAIVYNFRRGDGGSSGSRPGDTLST